MNCIYNSVKFLDIRLAYLYNMIWWNAQPHTNWQCAKIWVTSMMKWLVCLPLDPRFTGSNPASDEFLKVIENHSTPSFEWEVKSEALCHKILRQVENHFQLWTEILCKAKFSFLFPIPPACYRMNLLVGLPESSGGRVRSFPLSTSSFHRGSPCSYITWGMNNKPVGGHSSET
jgi:hypothetical protein